MIRQSLAAAALSLALATPVLAEPLPMPGVDFRAEMAILEGPGVMTVMRHKAGKMRVDVEQMGMKGFMLMERGKTVATMIMEIQPGVPMAMDIDLSKMAGQQQMNVATWDLDGRKVGSATVLGESCDEYETTQSGMTMRICIARDGVPLRTFDVGRNKPVMEARKVERVTQDAAQFAIPAGVTRMPAMPGMPGQTR